jgi:hypothetical protein
MRVLLSHACACRLARHAAGGDLSELTAAGCDEQASAAAVFGQFATEVKAAAIFKHLLVRILYVAKGAQA